MKKESKKSLDTDKKSIASLFSKDLLNEEATYELNKVVETENKLNKDDLIYKTGNKRKDDLQKFETARSFGREMYNNDLSVDDTLEEQIRLKGDIDIFKEPAKPKE